LVLLSQTNREYKVELKGDGAFTSRQLRALKRGSRASDKTRIDVLILPRWMKPPAGTHPDVHVVTWDEVDQKIFRGKNALGRLSDLWANESVVRWQQVREHARSYIAYGNGAAKGWVSWSSLWAPLDYLKDVLSDHYRFGRTSGCRRSDACWYYGMTIARRKSSWWLGWLFAGGTRGRMKMALVVEELEEGQKCRFRRTRLPSWYCNDSTGAVLALPEQSGEADLDLDAVAKVVRRTCR
jgi:hypothetical protein